jgi:hypothetical protein
MMIWGTQVSKTQFFGYSVALGGLLYYKLGAEQIKQYFSQGGRMWTEFGVQRPVARKLVILGLVVVTLLVLMGGLAPSYAPESSQNFKNYFSSGTGT